MWLVNLGYETHSYCAQCCLVHFENLKSYYFSVSNSGITQLHMIELSSFQGNILVTDPTRRDKNTALCGESL